MSPGSSFSGLRLRHGAEVTVLARRMLQLLRVKLVVWIEVLHVNCLEEVGIPQVS